MFFCRGPEMIPLFVRTQMHVHDYFLLNLHHFSCLHHHVLVLCLEKVWTFKIHHVANMPSTPRVVTMYDQFSHLVYLECTSCCKWYDYVVTKFQHSSTLSCLISGTNLIAWWFECVTKGALNYHHLIP